MWAAMSCGCGTVSAAEPAPAAPSLVEVKAPENVEPKKTPEQLEAESYVLGDHWWTSDRAKVVGTLSEQRNSWIRELLPARTSSLPRAVGASTRAPALAKRLKSAAGQGLHYWVQPVQGNPQADKTVIIVSQYHRATGLPVLWASLGAEVAAVQGNLEQLIGDLVQGENLQCIGTEGSSANLVTRSSGLDRAASWAQRLRNLFQRLLFEVAIEDQRVVPAAQMLLETLEPYFERYVRWQDGVGAALARENLEDVPVTRFGLEDDALVARAEALHLELLKLKKRQLVYAPADKGELAVRDMWLTEYPDFRDGFVLPGEESIGELRRALIGLRRDGATDEARLIGDFLGQIRVLMEQVLEINEVERYYKYYRDDFGRGRNRVKAGNAPAARRLNKRIADMEKQYQRLVMKSRERVAADRVLDKIKSTSNGICAIVMGAGHEKGLVKALGRASKKDVGIVVIRPYDH